MITASTTLRELAFIVGHTLRESGIPAVLVGGGAAVIYAPQACMSRDLDFVLDYHMFDPKPSDAPIRQLGFVRENSMYRHPTCPFTLEFLSAPLAVGNDVITTWDTLKEGDLALHIINPTDCVRDRLSGFIYYSDFSSLRQAVDVALIQAVDFSIIEKWCRSENALTAYEEFLVELKRAGTES